jgi:hypothetical protein
MNPINERIHAVGVWESLTMRKAGPLALVDQLCALPRPPLRFSRGWQNSWAFGPKSKSAASRNPVCLFPGQSTRHMLQQFVPTWPCHEAGESRREPNGEEYQNTYVSMTGWESTLGHWIPACAGMTTARSSFDKAPVYQR